MNLLNRVLTILLLLATAVVAVLVALIPQVVARWLRSLLPALEGGLDPTGQLLTSVFALLVAALALFLFLAEFRRTPRRSVIVAKMEGGTAELANESVAFRIRRVAESIPGIREALPLIVSRGKAIEVYLRLATDSDIDLPKKSQEVMAAVRSESETKMGIPVKGIKVTFKHSPASGRSAPPAPPTAPPPPSIPAEPTA